MKKRSLAMMLALVACLPGLVGCGETTDTRTEITLWSITGSNNQAQLQSYCDGFMEAYPQYKINNVIQTGMGYNELKDATEKGFSANNYPDLVQCYPDHVAEYIDYGKAVNLDPYIDNTEYGWSADDKADYISNFVDEGKSYASEGTYSVPYCKSTELMFYNADVLIGLVLPNINGGKALDQAYFDNLTWEELFDNLCPAIVTYNDGLADNAKILKTDQKYHSIFAYDSDDNLFITLCKQYGIPYTSVNTATGEGSIDFDTDAAKEKLTPVLTSFYNAAKKGYIISKGSAGNNYTNTYFTKQNTLFSVGSTGGVKYQFDADNPMDVGVARIPHAEGQNPYVINQGPSLCVLDHGSDDRKLGSWLFYKFMTNTTNALDWAINSGYMGIRESCYTNADYIAANDETTKDLKTLDRLMARSNTYSQKILAEMYTSPAFKGSSTARTQVSGVMTKVLTTSNDISKLSDWLKTAYDQTVLAM